LGEVVVTAQGRPQRPIEIPASLTVFDKNSLKAIDPHDLSDLAAFTPGLMIDTQYPSNPTILVRGIGTDTPDPTSEPRVSVFQDGVYLSHPQSALFELYDEERVEVGKGPQTTLFGRSALAGAIDVIQNKPRLAVSSADLKLEGGDYDHHLEQGVVNLPIGQYAALRLAAIDRATSGYVDNLAGGAAFNGVAVDAARAGLIYQPNAHFTLDFIGNIQRDRYTSPSTKSGVFLPTSPAFGQVLSSLSPSTGAFLTTAPSFVLGGEGGGRTLQSETLLATYDAGGGLTLDSTTAYTRTHTRIVSDYDGTSLSIATSGEDAVDAQVSQELRLIFDSKGPVKGFLGVSYADERGSQFIPVSLNEAEVLALKSGVIDRSSPTLAPEGFYTNPNVVAGELQAIASAEGQALSPSLANAIAANFSSDHTEVLDRLDHNRYADVFGDGVWRMTKRFELEAGVRYTAADKTTRLASLVTERSALAGFFGALALPPGQAQGLLQALATPGAEAVPTSESFPVPEFGLFDQPTATRAGDQDHHSDEGLGWRLSARYQLAETADVYLTYAHGRLPAVLSAETPLTPGGPVEFRVLAPETIDSIEAGFKRNPHGGRLKLEAALYALDYSHFDTVVLQNTALVNADVGQAQAYGAEFSGRWIASDLIDLSASYAYNHTRFETGLYRGNHFSLAPDNSLSFRGDLHIGALGGRLSLQPEVSWRSREYFDDTNGNLALESGGFLTPVPYRAFQPSVQLVNLRLVYRPSDAPWELGIYTDNLFDVRYIKDLGAGSLNIGLPSFIAGRPRMLGVAFSMHWGD